ncbi:MAG: hypothetical protein MRY63_10650 [Neomegalonema sp.]|nr:hypothetical protein [Neomegalonema sp.]
MSEAANTDAESWSRLWRHPGLSRAAACFDGHFPGAPLTPGAVLLAHAGRLLRAEGAPILEVARMKFLAPLAPECPFEIEAQGQGIAAELTWRSDTEILAKAKLRLAAPLKAAAAV